MRYTAALTEVRHGRSSGIMVDSLALEDIPYELPLIASSSVRAGRATCQASVLARRKPAVSKVISPDVFSSPWLHATQSPSIVFSLCAEILVQHK